MKKGKINKRNRIVSAIIAVVLVVAVGTGLLWQNGISADAATADDSTLTKWEQTTGDNTKNIGRIWTDKSVHTGDVTLPGGNAPEVAKGESDFLVTLSALSSAGKITGETTSVKPLDIVLVLDTSGSMGNSLSSETTYTFEETYDVERRGEYYAKTGTGNTVDDYTRIDRVGGRNGHWELNGQTVEPKTYSGDNSSDRIQFYTRDSNTVRVTKMQALKNAANSFIDSTAKENETISDESKKHRISLITYASDANTRYGLTVCDNENAATIKSTISGLSADGATAADYGMSYAQDVLGSENAREDAQKVVIFFTDGEPNHWSGFDSNVANNTITTSKALKEKNTKIYSVGMFDDADPSNENTNQENRFNAYMHGVSSNYPAATAWNNLGERAKDSEGNSTAYYKAAGNADDLNKIFDEIFKEINTVDPTSPVEEEVGGTENMNAITFHDELGDYMKVDDFKAIVFADTKYENPVKETNGNIDTYTFTAQVDGGVVYPSGNLNTIQITVERSTDLATGDKVTVVIPASMIPLRSYVVNTTGETSMSIDETYPLRLFYGASLKDGVEDNFANPDEALQDYIDANKDDNGQVNFYSNKYYENGTNNGGVYVEFEPNDTNDFYYFQEDEILYTGDAPSEVGGEPGNKQVATGTLDTSGNTIYYYDRLYYSLENDKPVEKHNWVQIPGDSNLPLAGFVDTNADGQLYIKMGTPRTTSLETHALNKTEASNKTGTAPYVTAPNWDNLKEPKNVIVKLGNNGLLKTDLPGTLEVAKTVNAVNGTPDENAEFTFDITLTGDNVKDSYTAQKFNAAGTAEGEATTISFTEGKAQVTLKDGEKIQIYGLATGTRYTVTEQEVADDGFTLSAKENDTGTIAAGAISAAKFTNDYSVVELEIQAEDFGLKGTKKITGREFKEGDIFKFDIAASEIAPDSPVPESGASVIIEPTSGTEAAIINFGDFKFTEAGHYRYSIKEYLPTGSGSEKYDKIIPGITYDTTNYRLTLDVVDNGNGELVATNVHIDKNTGEADDVTWTPVYPTDGADGAELPGVNPGYLEFTNTYAAESQTVSLTARKHMENKWLTDYSMKEQFGFVVEAGGSRAEGSSDEFETDENQPMPTANSAGKYIYRNDTTGVITIPHITFTPSAAPDDGSKVEYLYKIRELQPTNDGTFEGTGIEGAEKVNEKWTYKGVTFDSEVKEVKITVWNTVEEVDGVDTHIVNTQINYGDGNQVRFVNTYNASTETSITGTKEITGRAFNNDEFTFNIAAKDGAPLPVDADGHDVSSVTINPNSGNEATINFGTFKFDQSDMTGATKTVDSNGHASYEKTFKYTITEANLGADGVAYDTTPRELLITVKDDGFGNMTVEEPVLNNSTWTNVYTASMTLSDGIEISKTLTGRNMNPSEFTFTITPEGNAPALGDSDKNFTNTTWTADGQANVMTKLTSLKFTEADAGKEYTYVIDEVEGNAGGITYDKSQYKAVIAVTDNGDGTMTATTKFYRTMDKDGNAVTDPDNQDAPGLDVTAIAFNNSYAAGPGTLSGAANLMVTKDFTGRADNAWLDTDSFTFNLALTETPDGYQDGDVVMPNPATVTIDKDDKDNDYKDSFGDITFNKVGTYVFTISEVTDGLSDKGITCNTEPRTVTIVVSDPGTGTLVPTKAASSQALHFNNKYKAGAVGFAGINVEKTLSGREWKDSDSFEFTLEGNDEVTKAAIEAGDIKLPNPAEIEIKGTDADKTEAFKAITFTKEGNYSFKVTEVEPENAEDKIAGVSYDTTAKVVNIEVTDGTAGKLVAKVSNDDGSKADSTTVTVANTYTPADADPVATTGLFNKIISGRDWLDTDEFTFTIKPQNGGPNPEKTSVTVKSDKKDGEAVAFDFGKITFTPDHMLDTDGSRLTEKIFSYTIEEVNAGADEDGLQYSKNKATMNITVKDDGTGKLTVETPVIAVGEGTFQNNYYTDNATFARLNVKKTLTGRDWKDGDSFKFTLEPTGTTVKAVEDDVVVMPNPAEVTITDKTADRTATFGAITFAEAGTYTFNVTEEEGSIGGVQYAKDPKAVTIKVTDNKQGQLIAKVGDADTATVEFTNTYKAADTTFAKLNVAKALTGRDWKDGDSFKFTLVPTGDTVKAVEDGVVVMPDPATVTITDKTEGKKATFDAITFKAEGEYTFKITEEKGSIGGITYAPAQEVTITVTDPDKNGQLVAKVADQDEATLTFTNTYTPGASDPVATTGLFTKVIDGRDWLDDDTFTFTIEPQNGAPAPANTTATVTKANVKEGKAAFDFGTITFTADHMKDATENNGVKTKTFTYKVTENKARETENGLTYSSNVATMTITVTDDGTGKLTAGATAANGEFVNTYSSTLDYKASVNMFITKVLEGRELEANQFGFTMTPANQESADKFGIALAGREHFTRAADIGEESQMQVILGEDCGLFTADDVGKTYSYTVKETKVGETGYTNDTEDATVTITTTDDNKGKLTVTTTVEKGGKTTTTSVSTGEIKPGETPKTIKIPFVNYYNEEPGHLSDDGDATIEATKEITGRDLKDGEFKFTVTDKNGKEVATGTNDADGTIHFTDIEYAMETMEEDVDNGIATVDKESKYPEYIYTYQYTVSEKTDGLADKGITASTPSYNITVTVTDDAKGSLRIKVGYPDGKDKLEFKNQYGKDTANVAISGQKVLTMQSGDKKPDIAGKYTFKLTGSDGAPMPANDTAKNAADGTIAFGDITYTMDNTFGNEGTGRREKTFTYTVTETGSVAGVANDSEKTFKVKVVDDGNGHIAAETIGTNGALFKFDNTYSVKPESSSITDTIKIKKNLDGDRAMKDGEFKFELVEDDNVVAEATNNADGNVTFGAIEYTNVGTHEYIVREVNNGLGGITYDTNSYKIVTNVTDDGDGTLKVEHKRVADTEEEQKSDIVFTNTYKAAPTSVTLGAAKILKGGELKDKQFEFVLKDSKGNVVSKAKNNAEGAVQFEQMDFEKAGTYEYTISELNDKQKYVTYDETEYALTIEVTDDGNGNLTANVSYADEAKLVFVNKYDKPAKPEDKPTSNVPETGDKSPVIPLVILMIASMVCVVTAIYIRRKRKY